MLTLHFHRTNTLIGKTIRKIIGGKYNHVSIGVNGYIYEASMKKGVIKRKGDEDFNATYCKHFFGQNELACQKWLDKQVGKKYDWLGVLSFLWIFLPQRKGYWYCSELAIVALMKAVGQEEYNQKQSPMDLYYLTKLIN